MDRQIKKKKWPPRRIAGLVAIVLFVGLSAYAFLKDSGVRKLYVERDKLTISTVERGLFQEYTPVRGTVLPITTVYLDAQVGGRVDSLMVEEGTMLVRGDAILRLTNPDLELQVLNQEAELANRMEDLRSGELTMEQNLLGSRQALMEIEYRLRTEQRKYERYASLSESDRLAMMARQEWEEIEDDYGFTKQKRQLTLERHQQDSLLAATQVRRLRASVETTDKNLLVVRRRLDNLTLRAPISGQLTALNVDLGESIGRGMRLGHIDVLTSYKVRAAIDEYYITRVARGQKGEFDQADTPYELAIRRVYPEVRDGRFEVDLEFVGEPPPGVRRGQTVHIRLELGDLEEAVQVARGGFYQTTGGNWAYVLDEGGGVAAKRPIKLGRQNPRVYEVLEGLSPGDRVVTSSYENFGDNMDVLVLGD